MSLTGAAADFRAAVDAAPTVDAATFARRTRNAIAQLVLAAARSACPRSGPVEGVWGNREVPPATCSALRAHVGNELAAQLIALYDGGEGWTSRAIDVLEPLHTLTRR
ncbi:MAG TPA: hypothetical protein VGJ77_09230 [Gaiellaceae bacterium]